MIIANGYIVELTTTGGGIDKTTGHPVPVSETESTKRIPCQYSATKYNALSKSQGEPVTTQGYAILIENYDTLTSERLSLYDKAGQKVSDFSIISVEPLDAVGQTRILV